MSDLFKFSGRVVGDEKAEAKKIEHALVLVTSKKQSWLLHGVGVAIESDLDAGMGRDEAGPVGLAPEEPGIWVWEGTPGWTDPYNWEGINEGSEPIYEKRGTWRRMTSIEQTRFLLGALDEMWGPSQWPPLTVDKDLCPEGCKGIDLGDGNFSGCSCREGKLANGDPQPPDFLCDCPNHPKHRCHAASDGECIWEKCPQLKDGEPKKTERHCPLDKDEEES